MRIESGLRDLGLDRGVGIPRGLPSRLRRANQAASTYFAQKAPIPRLSPAVREDPDTMYRPLARVQPAFSGPFYYITKSCAFSVSVPPLWAVEHPDDMCIPQIGDMLAHPQLPPGLIERCLAVLKVIVPFKHELIRVVVEGFTTPLFDPTRRAKAWDEMTAEEGARADLTVLERVHENFEDNATLEGFLADLIISAVHRNTGPVHIDSTASPSAIYVDKFLVTIPSICKLSGFSVSGIPGPTPKYSIPPNGKWTWTGRITMTINAIAQTLCERATHPVQKGERGKQMIVARYKTITTRVILSRDCVDLSFSSCHHNASEISSARSNWGACTAPGAARKGRGLRPNMRSYVFLCSLPFVLLLTAERCGKRQQGQRTRAPEAQAKRKEDYLKCSRLKIAEHTDTHSQQARNFTYPVPFPDHFANAKPNTVNVTNIVEELWLTLPADLPNATDNDSMNLFIKSQEPTEEQRAAMGSGGTNEPEYLAIQWADAIPAETLKMLVRLWDTLRLLGVKFSEAEHQWSGMPALHLGLWEMYVKLIKITTDARQTKLTKRDLAKSAPKEEILAAIDELCRAVKEHVVPRLEQLMDCNVPGHRRVRERINTRVLHQLRSNKDFAQHPDQDFGSLFTSMAVKEGGS
ncbi:hypothetical protein B0H16DRAFT_1471866 [Mycena metata]|uniref:Uncharacterized protein n=1 Tax=Mycena metata TaxID=1033252 RepID=A0AAD7HPX9_9AGAR|nr:hypothetical protein B0H16DRAFT_1471866 [Mycena metata]